MPKVFHAFSLDGEYMRFHVGTKGVITVDEKDRIKRYEGPVSVGRFKNQKKEKRQPVTV